MGVSNAWAWWFVPGTWNNWDASEASNNGIAQMNGSNTITLYNIAAGSYEMKLVKGSTWGNGNYTNKSNSYITSVTKGNNSNDKIVINKACDLTFTITNQDTWNCDVSASDPTHYIKYNWNGSGWAWSGALTASNNYSCTGQYGGSASFDHTRKSSTDESGTNATGTTVNSPTKGDKCVFTYNTSTKALTITRCNKANQSKIYFDNSKTNWTNSNIYFIVGYDKPTAYSKVYKMSNISNTLLWYTDLGTDNWDDATYYAFIAADNEWSNGNWGSSNLNSAQHYTAAYTANYDLGNNKCYYFTPQTGDDNTTFTIEYKESYSNIQKYTAKQAAKTRNTINDSYTEVNGTWPTALKLQGTHLTGFGATNSDRNEISGSSSSGTNSYDAVTTGKITHTYNTISGNYIFEGWGTGDEPSTNNASYEYNITDNTIVYAFFTKAYTVTYGKKGEYGSSTVSATATANSTTKYISSGTKVAAGSTIQLTATPASGYRVVGWYSDANCTNQLQNGGNTYDAGTLTAAKTVYVKFEETKYDVTIQAGANGSVSPSGVQKVGNITPVNIEAIANDECEFVNWTKTGNITITKANNSATTIKATGAGTVTANFRKIEYTTVYLKPGEWSSDNARFAVYAYVDNDNYDWYDMIPVGCSNEYYQCNISKKYTKVIFCRMDPSKPANNWDNKWNQTSNLSVSANKIWTFTEWDNNSDGKDEGTWAAYNPTVTLTLKSSSNGIFRVRSNGKTYESSLTEDVQIELPLNATVTIIDANLPNPGYYLKEHFIKFGTNEKEETSIDVTHELCGNTTISANFVTKRPFTVYLKPNSDWKQSSPVFATYMYDEAGSNQWIRMTQVGDYYTCVIPKGWSNINIARLMPSGTSGYTNNNDGLDWKNKWNQTSSLSIPVTRINAYVIDESGTSTTKAQGHWADVATTAGDYRLLYVEQVVEKDKNNKTVITRKYEHPSDVIKKRSTTGIDTVSLHVYNQNRYNATYKWEGETSLTYETSSNSAVILQQYDGSKWVDLDNQHHMIFGPLEAHQYTAMLPGRRNATAEDEPLVAQLKADYGIKAIINDTHEDKGNGVWNFPIQQTVNGGNTTVELMRKDVHRYTGEYYIRTDNAAGGWQNYTHRNNHMTFSSYSKHNSHFSHYYCKWVNLNQDPWNVKFTIANDYGYSISDPLDGDDFVPKTGERQGQLQENANIRWSWNMVNNKVHRAYIQGAYNPVTHQRLKNIVIDYTTDGTTDPGDLTLGDSGDWIYKIDVKKVKNGATLKQLTATYPSKTTIDGIDPQIQIFEENLEMLTGENTTNEYIVRVLYDFKIDKTLVTLVPNENAADINIDLLVERINQGDATQVQAQVNSTRANDEGFTAYAVTSFTKEYLNDAANEHFREFYWVSFPFDVQISDVFGFGEYGVHWIMQYYDGEERAKKGCWVDSPTYWRFITDTTGNDWNNGILKANHGYVLTLDLDLMAETSPVFANSDTVSLYFPSMNQVNKLQIEQTSAPTFLKAYNCTIQRDNRYIKDSHWHLIGLPSYANTNQKTVNKDTEFLYIYNSDDTYTAKSTSESFDFKSLHAYMVQYTGNITWNNIVAEVPSQLAAKRSSDNKTRYSLRLEMQQNGNYADQAFVKLQDEKVTEAFDFNKDLTKLINAGANIYTFTNDQIEVAGNVMPIAETIIPVGVKITASGEYTFRMPEGTDGIVVELIDYETNTRTNMLLDEYTVNLEKGTFDNRFALHVKPSKVTTSVGDINTNSNGVKKYLIDGILYMQKDGVLYDAQGKLVR